MKSKPKKFRKVVKWNWDVLHWLIMYMIVFPLWIREVHYEEEKE